MGSVYLHVYPLSATGMGNMAYHAGVEFLGREWEYCADLGVRSIKPGTAGCGAFAEELAPIFMGVSQVSDDRLNTILAVMGRAFTRDSYHLVQHNCLHFARRLLEELGVAAMPEWVDAYTGKIAPVVQGAAAGGAVLGALALTSAAAAAPAAWAAVAGDVLGGGLGARLGGAVSGTQGALLGKELGSVGGSVGSGAAVGGVLGGPAGLGLGAGVGLLSYGLGKAVHLLVGSLSSPQALASISGTTASAIEALVGPVC